MMLQIVQNCFDTYSIVTFMSRSVLYRAYSVFITPLVINTVITGIDNKEYAGV